MIGRIESRQQAEKDRAVFVAVLLDLFPGRDVRVKFRTTDHRHLSGFWCWDLTSFEHKLTTHREILSTYQGEELHAFRRSIIYRVIRWKDVLRKYAEIESREQRQRNTRNNCYQP